MIRSEPFRPHVVEERIEFSGHPAIVATHPTTIELTADDRLTPRGDCIIGVRASKACRDLNLILKEHLKRNSSRVWIVLTAAGFVFQTRAYGNKRLLLTHAQDIVIRKSNFICPRTLAIRCDRAATDIPRRMVSALQNPLARGFMLIKVERST